MTGSCQVARVLIVSLPFTLLCGASGRTHGQQDASHFSVSTSRTLFYDSRFDSADVWPAQFTSPGQQSSTAASSPGAGQQASSPFAGVGSAPSSTTASQSQGGGAGQTGGITSVPRMFGDFFDGGARFVTLSGPVTTNFFALGQQIGTTGGGTPIFAFERDGIGFPNDIVTNGTPGVDASGDGNADTFAIQEPLPPNEVPVSPGAGFTFDGGTAVYTDSTTSTQPANGVASNGDWFISYSYSSNMEMVVPAGGGGVAVRRFKISENNSPLPKNRLFLHYNYFNDVQAGFGDVHRYAVGFEALLFNGRGSLETRLPFALTLDSDQLLNSIGARNGEVGDLLMIWKLLLRQTSQSALAAGLGLSVPTASGNRLSLADGRQILNIPNDSVHYLPYLAYATAPNDRFFNLTFLQFDLDGKGDRVFADAMGAPLGGSLPQIGRLNDASIMFVDTTFGWWLCRDTFGSKVTGIAPIVEFHYGTSLTNTDVVSGNGLTVADISRRIDILNLTLGTHFYPRRGPQMSVGFVLPLRNGDDRPFDYEGILQLNWLL